MKNHMDYAYDESGNITNINSTNLMGVAGLSSAEMVYNENNQLIEYNGKTVKYDADGNMIYGPLNGSMAEFKYDCRNRLISAGGTTYVYDAENNRISKTVNSVKTEYEKGGDKKPMKVVLPEVIEYIGQCVFYS